LESKRNNGNYTFVDYFCSCIVFTFQNIYAHKLVYPSGEKYDRFRGQANPYWQNMDLQELQMKFFACTLAHVVEHIDDYEDIILYEEMMKRPRYNLKFILKLSSSFKKKILLSLFKGNDGQSTFNFWLSRGID